VASADEGLEWIERMNQALASRNYSGTVLHERGGQSESLQVYRRVRGGQVSEKLASLDGSGREFIRRGENVMYVLPDRQHLVSERRPRNTSLLPRFPQLDERSTRFYVVSPVTRTRLTARDVRLVSITPRDPFRYGYRAWIDSRTHLPLKTELFDSEGGVLERVTFTSLSLLRDLPDDAFNPAVDTSAFQQVRLEPPRPRIQRVAGPRVWNVQPLPRGFRLTQSGEQSVPGSQLRVPHLVFSDGLASVSVFIGVDQPPLGPGDAGREHRMGASTAYSALIDGQYVVVVGEVPVRTARLIASQIRAARPAATAEPGSPAEPAAPAATAAPSQPAVPAQPASPLDP
jgi:sigma-E factor negative regulatory protein RseB